MKIFNLLIASIVAVFLIYLIMNMFVMPSKDIEADLSKGVVEALSKPGTPIIVEYSLLKGKTVSAQSLLQNNLLRDYSGLYVVFKTTNSKLRVDRSKSFNLLISKKNVLKDKASIVCFPFFTFVKSIEEENYNASQQKEFLENYSFFCEIVFGSELKPYKVGNVTKFKNKTVSLGEQKVIVDKKDFAKVFLFSVDNNIEFIEQIYFLRKNLGNSLRNVELINKKNYYFNFNESGKFFIVYMFGKKLISFEDLFNNNVIYPVNFIYDNVNVVVSEDDLKKNCKATNKIYGYFDLIKGKCVYYYHCEGCYLPEYCVDAWTEKGYNVSVNNVDFAEGYEECDEVKEDSIEQENRFEWPTYSHYVSSCFGYRPNIERHNKKNHYGVDIAGKLGDAIFAISDGKVVFAGGKYNTVVLDHGSFYSRYLHLNKIDVKVGDFVEKGDKVGEMGGYGPSGRFSYPVHLHFEIVLKNATPMGNIDDYEEDDVFLKETYGYAINPLCFYEGLFTYNKNSVVCSIQGGPLKWCSYYK